MLDPGRARAEADAAERRGAGTLWAVGPVEWEGVTAGTVEQAEVMPVVEAEAGEALRALPRGEARRGAQAVPTAILARLEIMPSRADVPAWLVEAIGNPLTYDAAATNRKDVCARVDPALYQRLQAMRVRLGLRTIAGAWEYVLRAGLAVAVRGL